MTINSKTAIFWCDLGQRCGSGHAMRCIALAEEVVRAGYEPLFILKAHEVPFIQDQLRIRGYEYLLPRDGHDATLSLIEDFDPQLVVIDSYVLPDLVYEELHKKHLTLAIIDGDIRGRRAHIYLDQNIGSESDVWRLPSDCHNSLRLAGLKYALIRDEVLDHRPERATTCKPTAQPKVLMVLGGTDPTNSTPLLAETLIGTRQSFSLTAITANEEALEQIVSLETLPSQEINAVKPTTELARLVREADLVISASGTSSWELLCLGAPTVFVCVAQNQAESYARVMKEGLGFGLGTSQSIPDHVDGVTATLSAVLTQSNMRSILSERGWRKVDGLGRQRVVKAIYEASG